MTTELDSTYELYKEALLTSSDERTPFMENIISFHEQYHGVLSYESAEDWDEDE